MIWSLHSCNNQQKWKCFIGVYLWRSGLCGLELIDVRVAPDWFEICVVCVQPAFPKEVITLTSYIPLTTAHLQTYQCNISFPPFFLLLHFHSFDFLIEFVTWNQQERLQCDCELHFPRVLVRQTICAFRSMSLSAAWQFASWGFSNFITKYTAAEQQHSDCPVLL